MSGTIPVTVNGKTYLSLKAVAKEFGLNYATIVARRKRGWSDCEIVYGRKRKKKARKTSSFQVTFRGKCYKNRPTLSRAFGVTIHAFRKRLDRGWTMEQALGIEKPPPKKANVQIVAGQTYKTQKDMLAAYSVHKTTFNARRARGWSIEQSLGIAAPPAEQRHSRLSKWIEVRGRRFDSLAECAKAYGISNQTLSYRLSQGWTPEQAVGVHTHKARRQKTRIVCAGIRYENYVGLARKFGLPMKKVHRRINDFGWTPEQAVGLETPPGPEQFEVEGKAYQSFNHACTAYGFSFKTVSERLAKGWRTEQAFGLIDPPVGRHTVEFRGKRFENVSALAFAYGFSGRKIIDRRLQGWSLEESLELVDRPDYQSGLYREKYFEKHPELKAEQCNVYFLALKDQERTEKFYKIGISVDTKTRTKSIAADGYDVQIVTKISLNLYSAWQVEQMLFEEYADQRFTPDSATFGGRTECFRFQPDEVENVTNLINEFSDISS